MNLIESLNWRYATKKFSDRKVSAEDIDQILAAANLSASSTGLQPYRLILVENPDLRKKLGESSFNAQIIESSHLLVFAAFEKVTLQHVESYISYVASQRGVSVESMDAFKGALVNGILSRTDEVNFTWASRQAYIALGTALIAAADLKIDATPMEGFDNAKFDQLLNLKEKGLKSVVIMAIGYRHEEDIFANFKKVRLQQEDFVTVMR